MNFDPTLISSVVPALLILIIAYYTLGGAIKGFRKALYRFCAFIIFLAIGYYSMLWFATFMVEGNGIALLTSYVDLSGFIGSATTFSEAVTNIATNMINMTPNQDTIEMIGALVSLIIKVVYFIVYVFVIRIVYWIIEKIVWILFFRASKFYKKNYTTKKRSLGAAVGFAKGVIIATFVGVAINGFVGIVPFFDFSVLDEAHQQDGQQNLSQSNTVVSPNILQMLDSMGLRPVFEAVDVYKQTRFSQVLNTVEVGEKPIDAYVLDAIFTGKYQDFTIEGLTELKQLVAVATAAADIYFSPNGFDPMTINIGQLAPIFEAVANSNLIMKLIPIGVNYALTMDFVNNLPYGITLDPDTFANIDWANDFTLMGELATSLGEMGDGTIANLEFSGANIQTLAGIVKNMTIITEVMPILVGVALDIPEVQQYVGEITDDISNIDWSDEIDAFANIYASFTDLGIASFDNIIADFLGTADTPELRSFFESIFTSQFINIVFSQAIDSSLDTFFGDDPTVGPLLDLIDFSDITSAEWVDEFMTIVSLAHSITPDGTFSDFGLEQIVNISADTIAQSTILRRAIKAFIATAYLPDSLATSVGISSYLVVPMSFQDFDDPSWDADTDGDTIPEEDGEITNFIRGLKAIVDIVVGDGTFDLSTINPGQLIDGIDDALIEDITSSILLRTFISNALLPLLDETGGIVIVPDEVKQNITSLEYDDATQQAVEVQHQILRAEELERMLKAAKELAGIFFDETGNFSFDFENLTTILSDPALANGLNYIVGSSNGLIKPSLIMQATVSKYIIDMDVSNGGMIVLPTSSMQTTFAINDEETLTITSVPLVKGTQLRLLFDIVIDSNINLTSLDSFDFGIVNNLVVSVNNGNLGNCDILNATLTKFVIDNLASTITLPKQVITNTAPGAQMLDSAQFLTKSELENLVLAIVAFDIDDITTIGFETITSITNDATWQTIFSSKILQVTVSKFVVDMTSGSGIIIVPHDATIVDPLDSMTYGAYEPVGTYTDLSDNALEVLTATELRHLISGINTLISGMVNTSDADPNNDTLEDVLSNSPTAIVENIDASNIDQITQSKILYATISKFIFDLNGTITIPGYFGGATTQSSGVVLQLGDKFVVDSNEILALLDGFSALGGSIDSAISVTSVINRSEAEIQAIFASVIVRATATGLLTDLADSGTLIIPGYNGTTHVVTAGAAIDMIATSPVIQQTEFVQLILTAKVLGLADLSDAILDAISVNNLLTNQATIFGTLVGGNYVGGTTIFQATMSKMILDVGASLTIPNSDIFTYVDTVNRYIATSEVIALLDGLKALGINGLDSSSVNIGISTLTGLSNANFTTALASHILHYTMSEQIRSNASGTITIPSDAYTNTEINDTGFYLMKDTEIIDFIGALSTLAITDAASVGISNVLNLIQFTYVGPDITAVDSTKISGGDKAMMDSIIIWNYVSQSLVDNAVAIIIPTIVYDGTIVTRIQKAEIVKMLVSMKVLGLTTAVGVDVGVSDLSDLTTTNLNLTLESDIIYYTVSEKVRTNGTLNIPDDAYTATYINGTSDPKLIKKDELKNFIGALKVLGGDNANDVTFATVLGKITYTKDGSDNFTAADTSNVATMLDSIIIWHYMSESIVNSTSSSMVVPSSAYDAIVTSRIDKLEIQHMLAAMGIMGFTDPNTIAIEDTLLSSLTNTELSLILESDIMWYSISKYFIDNHSAQITLAGITIHTDGEGKQYIERADIQTLKNLI